ncbi:alpha-amylase family glycosyl hydrolase [Mycoplasmopsis gallopavonis]|uniref:Alpha-amylase n=1 Tax=Mycoplasmopsis gallopavonis TaxID=76629 RepID=A0A449B0K3_9BACT|nr:alpha-amylase family glycosyl hydrolase [Mycoplasmopsis gallopavonis]RIV16995.1 sucrase-isomaltase [Mycoplasmopsis gallopavonis]VEU73300.1 Oligo-1,6-glucosidase [Mycoplasmopsis gallopavonis]
MQIKQLKDKILYQIFPRSFYDSNNDGNGDLQGIISKLDYLKDLGINGIWLCPIYETNFVDAGYDVLDYKSVWKQFGTLEDFATLTKEARKRGIDIIMDIVLNHVSNQHEWFKKACESRTNKEHDYFIWRDELSEAEKQAQSIFGGPAWEYVPSVNRYYFHLFAKEQVDLNWANPNTCKAMAEVIDFWYNLGVRGFRLDAIKHVAKTFDNVAANPAFVWCDGAVEYLQLFNELAFKNKPDAYTFGEASGISANELLNYGLSKNKVADNYYNFAWWWIGWGKVTGRNGYDANWDYREFVYQQKPFQENEAIPAYSFTNFLSNHDTARSVSRWGSETFFRKQSAKTHALLLLSLKGVPCLYYGEEIGLTNTIFNSRNEFRDVDIFNGFKELVDQKQIYSESEMLLYCNINSRDAGRGLMQWDTSVNAGFNSGAEPWIKRGHNKEEINVASQANDPTSILNFYKKLIQLRTNDLKDLLIDGTSTIDLQPSGVIEVVRKYKDQEVYVYLNMTSKELELTKISGKQILSSYDDNKQVETKLRPYESVLIQK